MAGELVLGIDGCRAGWLAIAATSSELTPLLFETRQQLLDALMKAGLTFIDIPIGLSECQASRPCDRLLRQALGSRFRASVFNPPVREAVYARSYREACDRNAAATGKKISKQSWNITPKIRMLDELLQEKPSLRLTVLESHPEFLFFNLNGEQVLSHKKKLPEGRLERLEILERCWPGVNRVYEQVRSQFMKKQVADDDIVDALGLAIGASFAAKNGGPNSLPTPIEGDSKGIPMAIHFAKL